MAAASENTPPETEDFYDQFSETPQAYVAAQINKGRPRPTLYRLGSVLAQSLGCIELIDTSETAQAGRLLLNASERPRIARVTRGEPPTLVVGALAGGDGSYEEALRAGVVPPQAPCRRAGLGGGWL